MAGNQGQGNRPGQQNPMKPPSAGQQQPGQREEQEEEESGSRREEEEESTPVRPQGGQDQPETQRNDPTGRR